MKIVVCSLYVNPWYREIVKYGKRSLEQYCKKHGYGFYYETEETLNGVYDGERDIPWYKVQLLLRVMNAIECDFVVWNDADTQIVNDEQKLEDFITNDLGDRDFLVAKDWKSTLNTGTMFVRNSPYAKKLLTEVWNNSEEFDCNLHEQASLGDLYTRNVMDCANHIVILPLERQNAFLTYWYSFVPNACFIVHATRCAHDKAGFVFTMDMFCMLKMDEESDEEWKARIKRLRSSEITDEIAHYRNNGQRRNVGARYSLLLKGQLKGV